MAIHLNVQNHFCAKEVIVSYKVDTCCDYKNCGSRVSGPILLSEPYTAQKYSLQNRNTERSNTGKVKSRKW